MIRITKSRKVKYVSIGFSCSKELWDNEANLPKKKHPMYKEASILIQKKLLDANKLVINLENEDRDLSAYELKGKLKKAAVANFQVLIYFDKTIQRLQKSGQIKTAEVYKDTKRNLEYHLKGAQIFFSDIDIHFLNQFENHLKAVGKGNNTIYIYLRTLRSLVNKAIKEGVCAEKHYAFKGFSLARYSSIKTEKRAISKGDISKIAKLKINKYPHLFDAYNIFLFSYYCRGMNFTDIAFLKWQSIRKDNLSYVRQKTKEKFQMKLLKPALDILEYYKPSRPSANLYVFPIFNETHILPKTLFNRKVKMLRKTNKDLKEIGKLAKLDTELTTYVARHTFATVMKKEGINTSLISEMLGHDSEKTTQIYLDSFGNEVLDEASKALL